MAGAPPPYPPPGPPPPYPPPGPPPPYPPPGYDPRDQRRYMRDQERARRNAIRAQRDHFRYQMRGLRRGSILGPILLIGAGIVFLLLQTGRLDPHLFWDWYGRRWPILLVVAGILLLAEWAFDQFYLSNPEHPRYRRSIGGGPFMLFLLFAVVGAAVSHGFNFHPGPGPMIFNGFHLNPDSFDELFGDKHESDQSLDYALPAGSSLVLTNPHGDVTVTGTSGDGRIHIAIHKQVYARTDAEADTKAQQLIPQISNQSSSQTTITHNDNRFSTLTATSVPSLNLTMPSLDGTRADLILTVPAAAMTIVTANHGDIHVASIQAAVTATANHGDIDLSSITGPANVRINNSGSSLSAHTMGGDVVVEGRVQDITLVEVTGSISIAGEVFGTTHLEHINGSVRYHTSRADFQLARLDGEAEISRDSDLTADQVVGPVVLTTHNRNIILDRVSGNISVTNHNGTIDLTAAPTLGNITLENRVGSIKVILPDHAGFSLQADTTNGDIDTDLPLSTASSGGDTLRNDQHHSSRDSHKTMSGTIGTGGPLIHITTTNGDISIHKGTVAPLPPTAPAPPKPILTQPSATTPPKDPKDPKHKPKESEHPPTEPAPTN